MNIQQTKVTSCKDDLLFAKLVQDADIIMYIMDSIFRSIDFHINFKPGNPIPLGLGRKGSFFTKK